MLSIQRASRVAIREGPLKFAFSIAKNAFFGIIFLLLKAVYIGEMAEWLKAPVLKTGDSERGP
jgi:hypothetical protein